jgi:NADP-dependent 3-hydroxy acid dehydrogenase YdfG
VTASPRVVLVTGATSGIGAAVARRFGAEGARVHAVGRDPARLAEVCSGTTEAGGEAVPQKTDLCADQELDALVEAVRDREDHLDVLVHAAGVLRLGSVDRATDADLDAQYRLNLRAPFRLTRGLLPLLEACRGDVVFINSTAGLVGSPGSACYAATKHGLRGLADSLRDEVNVRGVRVLSVFPGRASTPMQQSLHDLEGREFRPDRLLQPADVAEILVRAVGLPETAEVTEIRIRPRLKS